MAELLKETVITENGTGEVLTTTPDRVIINSKDSDEPIMTTQVQTSATKSQTSEYLVYYIFGGLEILLAFRLVLKLMGASIASGFVSLIYGITGLFTSPFEGIFSRTLSQGIETTSVLEPATIVAILVYALLAWGVVKLIRIISKEQQ